MKSRDVILAIDEGTSGTRAAVVDASGHVSCLQYATLQVNSPHTGIVEQDADTILDKTLHVCRATIAQAQHNGLRIVGLGITTQRATAVLWDKHTGEALVPAMVWQDTRYTAELGGLAKHWDDRLLQTAGRPCGVRSPYLWAVHHLRDTPAVAHAFERESLMFGTVDTWLLWHLSEQRPHVTTPTNAVSANAYRLAEHAYYLDWLDALKFPHQLLPSLRQDADDFGRTRADLLGIDVPILASAGDQHAGAIGLGCLERGQAMCVHGTGSFVDLIVGDTLPAQRAEHETTLTMVARRQHDVTHLSVETFVATTGSALNWLCDKLNWFDDAKQISALAAKTDTSGGACFLPALTGLRVPCLEPDARACLSGVSMATTRNQIAYAILEGIAHSVASCLECDETVAGLTAGELIVGGGLSSSDVLLQIQADLSDIPIRRMDEADRASLRGIAYLAGSSGLLWDSLSEACATAKTDTVFTPAMDTDMRLLRRAQWQARVQSELRHARGVA